MRHEGTLGATFADGGVGAAYAAGKVLVVRVGERELEPDEFEARPEDEVTGWVMACSCGWRGEQWHRADVTDVSRRRAYSPWPSPPMDDIEEYTSAEYQDHIAPIRAEVLAEISVSATPELVGRARELGAEWPEIAAAAGLTTQAAHERWRDAPMQVFTRRHGAELAALARLAGA